MQFLSEWTRGPLCLSAPAPGQYAGVCGLLLSFANTGMLPLYGAPRFWGRKHGTVHALRLHCALAFIACACMAAFATQWFGDALHSHHVVSLGISTLMSFKCVWYLHSCSFGLHSLHAGPCPPSHHRTHFACSRAWARGAGFWLHGVLHVLLRQVLVLDACLCSRSFFAVVGHGALVLAFSALLLIYASSFSWAVPLRGPKRERYTVVLAPPPCKIPTTTSGGR